MPATPKLSYWLLSYTQAFPSTFLTSWGEASADARAVGMDVRSISAAATAMMTTTMRLDTGDSRARRCHVCHGIAFLRASMLGADAVSVLSLPVTLHRRRRPCKRNLRQIATQRVRRPQARRLTAPQIRDQCPDAKEPIRPSGAEFPLLVLGFVALAVLVDGVPVPEHHGESERERKLLDQKVEGEDVLDVGGGLRAP